MTEPKQTTLAEVVAGPKPAADPVPGFFSAQGMTLLEKAAGILANSDMVPTQYRHQYMKSGKLVVNDAGMANCVVAVNMAHSIGIDVLTVMQNLHVIEGRPSWAASFLIARINASGLFSRLMFDMSDPGEEVEAEYTEYEGWGQNRTSTKRRATMRHQTCRAWAKDLSTGQVLKGTEISVKMAISEGWARKAGSKWHTMQEQMLQYRAAAFWCRIHAPELLSGLPTDDEVRDTIEAEIVDGVMTAKPVPAEELKTPRRKQAKQQAEDAQVVGEQPAGEDRKPEPEAAVQSSPAPEEVPQEQQQQTQPRQRRTAGASNFNVE